MQGSYFENSKLPIRDILSLIYLWCADIPVGCVPFMMSVSKQIAIQWYQYFQDVCTHQLLKIKNGGFKLGGPGRIVQIDESVLTKRKYHRGKKIKEQWIFGMYDTELKFGVMLYVKDRTRETLLGLIQAYVANGSIIWSDQWAAYRQITSLPENYQHGTVNHSLHFKDPQSGVCTNQVEGYWSGLKKCLRRKNVMAARKHLPSYLDEYVWRTNYRCPRPIETMKSFLSHLATWDQYGFL
jgi:IS1 family transposase